ncbi:MAG: hypothetical protein ABH859_06330 [Pseudomonadota bacterium]
MKYLMSCVLIVFIATPLFAQEVVSSKDEPVAAGQEQPLTDLPDDLYEPSTPPENAIPLEELKPNVRSQVQQLDMPEEQMGHYGKQPTIPADAGWVKTDLPPGWEAPPAVPAGAVRLEDVQPGKTKPVPAGIPAEAASETAPAVSGVTDTRNMPAWRPGEPSPTTISAPPPPLEPPRVPVPEPVPVVEEPIAPITVPETQPEPLPAAEEPSVAVPEEKVFRYKSDLPEGWEEPVHVPEGAVPIEKVKPGETKHKNKQPKPTEDTSSMAPPQVDTSVKEVNEQTIEQGGVEVQEEQYDVYHRWEK